MNQLSFLRTLRRMWLVVLSLRHSFSQSIIVNHGVRTADNGKRYVLIDDVIEDEIERIERR